MSAAKRTYSSPLRDEAARRTRTTIRNAAATLFERSGYVSTTVKQIAAEAGVAVRTVFTAFPEGKAQLFREALDAAVTGDAADADLGAPGSPQSRSPRASGAAAAVIDQVVGYGAAMLERAGGLL
ncbi:MAG: helix-turn-helix transcriptional regulator, partial [Rhodococcus sp.]|nr:helix-turn-helix transcriptional regulator [Rhodococcus sp. (in: high G+C Gram-positive bacteria)]